MVTAAGAEGFLGGAAPGEAPPGTSWVEGDVVAEAGLASAAAEMLAGVEMEVVQVAGGSTGGCAGDELPAEAVVTT